MSKFTRNAVSLGLLSVLILGLTFLLTGCGFINQDPTAKISATPDLSNDIEVGTQIDFDGSNSEDDDGEINDYDWDFKTDKSEDATSTAENPSYTYSETGTYTVTLTVTDDDGETDSTTATVTIVDSGLDASFTMSPDPANTGQEVTFDASGSTGTIDNYKWDFDGDGTIDENITDATTTHTYSNADDYTVELTIENTTTGDVALSGKTLEVQTD